MRILLLSLALLWPLLGYADEEVQFDCNRKNFPEIRKYIYEKEAENFEDFHNHVNRDIYPDGMKYDYCLALLDINADGQKDVFRHYDFGSVFCGSAGCSRDLFVVEPNGEWREVLQVTGESILVTDGYKNGYRILKVYMRISCAEKPQACESEHGQHDSKKGSDFYPFRFAYDPVLKRYLRVE